MTLVLMMKIGCYGKMCNSDETAVAIILVSLALCFFFFLFVFFVCGNEGTIG